MAGRRGRVQTIFGRGRLVALHACAQVEEGVGGGDLIKESIVSRDLETNVERLGAHLGWHGALSLDFVQDASGRCVFIDSNPRLAEPGNALAAGLNLPALLVRVSLGELPPWVPSAPSGVRSYMGLQGLLRSARDRRSRGAVLRSLAELLTHRSRFAAGTEELVPVPGDVRSALPLALVSAVLLANPRLWSSFSSGAVDAYAATPRVVEFVHGGPAESGWRSRPV